MSQEFGMISGLIQQEIRHIQKGVHGAFKGKEVY